MKKYDLILYCLVVFVAVALIFALYSELKPRYQTDADFSKIENINDKCKAPAGYTQEQWNEHMGHHPDRYAECLT